MKNKMLITTWCCLVIHMTCPDLHAKSPEEEVIHMVSRIYMEVSGQGEHSVDWEKVRSFFAEEAVIVLRTSREATSQFTVDGFIQDFKTFYQSPRVGEAGFKEEVLQLESHVYLDMAFVAVVYEAAILDSEIPPQKGIDFWLLTRRDDAWKVVSVTNEVIPPNGALPGIFTPQLSR